MDSATIKALIPDSVIPYPEGVLDQAKYWFWKVVTPAYGLGLNLLLTLRIIHHEGRQSYVIGKLAPDVKVEDFLVYLHGQQFGNHFIAWTDDDELVSMRRLDGFTWQYHLRIHTDGQVRGHYEYTPEAHPKWHMQEIGMQQKKEDFLRFLGDWIIPAEKMSDKELQGRDVKERIFMFSPLHSSGK